MTMPDRMSIPAGDRTWVKALVDGRWPYQIVESMNHLLDRAEIAEAEVERLREALSRVREEFRNPEGYDDDDPVVRIVNEALS